MMVDFKKALENPWSEHGLETRPQPRTVTISATRTNCFTGTVSTVEIKCDLRDNGNVFAIDEGGVTGHEVFYIKDFMDQRAWRGEPSCVWIACNGTRERWDRLVVSDEEMRRAFAAFGIEVT